MVRAEGGSGSVSSGDRHVVAIHLGPVQEFLAAARRTRDLWFGSWLLSELAGAAARAIEARHPGSVIFPSLWGDDGSPVGPDATCANKILARVPDDPAGAVEAAVSALYLRLDALRETAFGPLRHLDAKKEFRRLEAEAQIADLLEIQWASAPEVGGEAGYAAARRTAEQCLGARKNARDWVQPTWGAAVPKSAIDGLRESVIAEELFDASTAPSLGWGSARLRSRPSASTAQSASTASRC